MHLDSSLEPAQHLPRPRLQVAHLGHRCRSSYPHRLESAIELHTPRLHLRELLLEDAEAANVYERDPEVVRYQGHDVRTLDQSRAYIASSLAAAAEHPRNVFDLAVTLRSTGQYLGRIGFAIKSREQREAMLWYVLSPAHHGQGYATEAAQALLAFAFAELDMHRLYVDCDPRNLASIRVAERLGMRREGLLRENFWSKGEWTDSLLLALLEREWRACIRNEPVASMS